MNHIPRKDNMKQLPRQYSKEDHAKAVEILATNYAHQAIDGISEYLGDAFEEGQDKAKHILDYICGFDSMNNERKPDDL